MEILKVFCVNFSFMLGLSILVKPPKKQIIFNNAMNIYFVEKYKNLDLWYTNNDYSVFRKDFRVELEKLK